MINLYGTHYPKEVTLYAVYFYVRYDASYRNFEEMGG
jgi:putative transposase